MLTPEQYATLLEKAPEVSEHFALALVLCHETGHRLNSVRQLRWSDVDLEARVIAWRAETDKSGKAHVTPLTEGAVDALRLARLRSGRIGDGWLFPSARRKGRALRTNAFQDWWGRAADLAGLELPAGCRFHALRRKLASELVQEQLAVVQAVGGWSQPDVVVRRYQRVSLDVQREVMARRRSG